MSPVANGTGEKYGNFDLVTRAKLDYADILVSKWKSRVTGLSVVHLDYAGMLLMLSLLCVVGDGDVNIDTKVQHPSSMDILLLVQRVSGHRHLSVVALTLLSLVVFNDSGCPHTLEQCVTLSAYEVLTNFGTCSLVFMGSEKYPYKGIIDHLANRGFSNGTNAWTDNDHTAYTVSTAGEQGFLQLLPIYINHILYPTLTKAGFITEVSLLAFPFRK